jgi:hypothetical protein
LLVLAVFGQVSRRGPFSWPGFSLAIADNVVVPKENLLGKEGDGFKVGAV